MGRIFLSYPPAYLAAVRGDSARHARNALSLAYTLRHRLADAGMVTSVLNVFHQSVSGNPATSVTINRDRGDKLYTAKIRKSSLARIPSRFETFKDLRFPLGEA